MLFFKKNSNKYTDFTALGIDMHSHLIPGVDDGSKDVANSLELINGLRALGFTHLFTTPHTLQDIHPNTCDTLRAGHNLLRSHLPPDIHLEVSSEYYLDEQFLKQRQSAALLPLPGNRILMEFSQISMPHNLEEEIFQTGLEGYDIILAHPERYLFFHKNFDYYSRLKNMGVEFQVNALSLSGFYGDKIKSVAEKLIKHDFIDFLGTDLHNLTQLEQLKHVPKTKSFERLMQSGLLKNRSLIEG